MLNRPFDVKPVVLDTASAVVGINVASISPSVVSIEVFVEIGAGVLDVDVKVSIEVKPKVVIISSSVVAKGVLEEIGAEEVVS